MTIVICSLLHIKGYGQSYLSVQGDINYWQHSEVFGPGIGLGYRYQFDHFSISFNYSFGYGSINRIDKYDDVNYDHWSTVFINTDKGKWREDYIGVSDGGYFNELRGKSDYGKQHQLAIRLDYKLFEIGESTVKAHTGLYGALVDQFFTFDNIPVHYIELPSAYSGPLNYIPSTTQRIITYGLQVEVSGNWTFQNRMMSPYLSTGIGPNYASFVSIGFRLQTQLLKK